MGTLVTILAIIQSPVVVWIVMWILGVNERLAKHDGRLDVLEQRNIDLPALIDTKFDNLGDQMDSVERRLERIEDIVRNGKH